MNSAIAWQEWKFGSSIHAYQSYVKFSILVLGATHLITKKSMAHLTFDVRDTNVEASTPPSLRCNLASRRGESKICAGVL